jgi:precorrin-2 dehydrogenase/sirohydrochlorin ferrochelatase
MNSASADDHRCFFPILVSLAGRKCLVIGAGRIAAAKVEGLLACGASVTVVSPRAVPAIRQRAIAGTLLWRGRPFRTRDLDGAFLAVTATNSKKTNAAVFRACVERGVLCNSVDAPEQCDFIYPAVVRRGSLQIAISTGGRSPALAARLRRELERQFGPEWGAWVEEIGQRRQSLLAHPMSAGLRRRRLSEMVTPKAFRKHLRSASRRTVKRAKKKLD